MARGGAWLLHCVPHTEKRFGMLTALLPLAKGACLGKLQADQNSPDWARIASEAARTIPGRENGGNCDIKNLSRGCKVRT